MTRPINVACIGDSLTEGGYTKNLQEVLNSRDPSCNWNVKKWAQLGSTTKDWVQKFLVGPGNGLQSLVASGVDVFVIMLGTNDCQAHLPFSENFTMDNLTKIVQTFKAIGAPIVLATPPPIFKGGGQYADYMNANNLANVITRIVKQIAASQGCAHCDVFSALGGARPNPQAYTDGVHLHPEGNRLVAEAIAPVVMSAVGSEATAPSKERASSLSYAAPTGQLTSNIIGTPAKKKQQGPTTVMQASSTLLPAALYSIGDTVEVFSKSSGTWFKGAITKKEGNKVLAEFIGPDGKYKEKFLPVDHQDIRPVSTTEALEKNSILEPYRLDAYQSNQISDIGLPAKTYTAPVTNAVSMGGIYQSTLSPTQGTYMAAAPLSASPLSARAASTTITTIAGPNTTIAGPTTTIAAPTTTISGPTTTRAGLSPSSVVTPTFTGTSSFKTSLAGTTSFAATPSITGTTSFSATPTFTGTSKIQTSYCSSGTNISTTASPMPSFSSYPAMRSKSFDAARFQHPASLATATTRTINPPLNKPSRIRSFH